jgi:iron complex outermembrane receptor protein
MALFRWLILLVCFLPIGLYAQLGRDSIWSLPSVQVSASRLQFQDWGLKVEKLDSLQAQVFGAANIGDWLFNASQAFIKNYGTGRLATSSLRGGSASQSIVLWNGFNVQNPMLGQTDLSLLPISLMDEVRVDLGSSSVLWGSGAIGGAIQLNNSNSVIAQSGWQARLQTGLGSFNNRYAQGKLLYRNRHWTSVLRGLSNSAQNNYPYRDFFGEKKRLAHSQLRMNSILWENYWQTRNTSLSWHTWYQNTHREIPPISSQQSSQAQQYDAAFRTMIDAKHYGHWGKLNLRGALFREQLDYQDSLVQLDSKSKAWTAIGEAILETAAYKWGHAQVGFHHTGVWATASNYEGQIQQQRNAFFAQFEPPILQKKWRSLLQLRQEWVDGRRLPILPGLRIQGQMGLLQLHASLNRNYRIPTLNDLHWVPGGNSLLRPEQGWSSEMGWNWEKKNEQSGWQLGITGFNRVIQDWILWLPGTA